MGKRTKYDPGTFCWADLSTSDADAAKSFYGELFGWESSDMPTDGGPTYSLQQIDGDDVCALHDFGPDQLEQGVLPHWFCYVSTDDADATAAKASELGGTVQAEPFDVMDVGRMAAIQDPTGGWFAAWQPKQSIGAGRVNDEGCMAWNELSTRDMKAAESFYGDLFGWEFEPMDTGDAPPYSIVKNAGSSNGGIREMSAEEGDVPPNWLPYFTVASSDATAEKVKDLGGQVMAGPMDVGAGRIAVMLDPQGAAFAVFEGDTDD